MVLENLVNIRGDYAAVFNRLLRDTVQCADEITTQRRTDTNLRNHWFWTANTALYRTEDKQPILYFLNGDVSRELNPIFNNVETAVDDLISKKDYRPSEEEVKEVIGADPVLRVNLLDLSLKRNEYGSFYFDIPTKGYEDLTQPQFSFTELVFGQGDDLKENMKMLRASGIAKTRISVPNPQYILDNAGDGIVRPCSLYNLKTGSFFNAEISKLDVPVFCMRGVKKPR